MSSRLLSVICSMLLLLAGCMVGPKYNRPAAPVPSAYKEQLPQPSPASKEWKLAHPNADVLPTNWWEVFQDPKMNALEQEVTDSNQNLKVSEARFRQARAAVRYYRAAEFPTISVSPGIQALRYTPNQSYFPATVGGITSAANFLLPFDVSYEADLWGRVRRTVASAREETQAASADLAWVGLSLHAELAYDYFELRNADAQQKLLDDTVKSYADMVELTSALFEGGAAPESDVVQARTQLDTARVQDTDIAVMRTQYEHAIAILIGKPPAEFTLPPEVRGFEPPPVPVGLPSQLLERRPDIAASERRVQEANEGIGIARAAYFPTVTLGGEVGLETSTVSGIAKWFTWPSRFWAIGPSATEILFDAGRRRATTLQAQANYDAAVATYRETTLEAFQQVEDNLSALRILQRESAEQQAAVAEALRSVKLFTDLYEGGADPYLEVVTAETVALQNERNQVDILRRRLEATVLLVKALGGGWNLSELPPNNSLH